MAVVVCLGNPGRRYRETRHNVGFQVLDLLVARWRARPAERTGSHRSWQAEVRGRGVTLLQPLTFMNASGEALREWARGRELDLAALLVVCDDVYLPPGTLRLRRAGSSGGHRGLESIESALGTRAYGRLRIGVGAARSAAELREHVLATPARDEEEVHQASLGRAADAVECWLVDGMAAAMNLFNTPKAKEVTEE